MNTPAFTPGPWHASKPLGAPYFGISATNGYMVVGTSSGLGEADARLIAAAPELYEALHKIAYEPIGDPLASVREVFDACVEIAQAALAKAVQP